MAVAALVLSLSVARQRGDARRDASEDAPGRAPAAAKLDLNALRTAGL